MEKDMYYVYVLKICKDGKLYTGYSSNLKKRLNEHNKGHIEAIKIKYPLELM